MGISPQRVFIYDQPRSCEIFMNDGDTSNASSYGSCDITHGKSVTWSMANNANYDFLYTYSFDTDLEGKDGNAIARYVEGSTYLWVSCLDVPEPEPITISAEAIIVTEL